MKKIISSKLIALTFGILTICFAVGFYISAAWQNAAVNAPGDNVAAPLNTSNTGQTKAGGLMLNTGGATYGLIVQSGNVGIGTAAPSTKLEVSGGDAKFGSSMILAPTSQPSSPQQGQLYFNQTDKYLYYYNNTQWVKVGAQECSPVCGTCKTCASGQCFNMAAGTVDPNGCSQTHYRCDGLGACTAPTVKSGSVTASCITSSVYVQSQFCKLKYSSCSCDPYALPPGPSPDVPNTVCQAAGHDGCFCKDCTGDCINLANPNGTCSLNTCVTGGMAGCGEWDICHYFYATIFCWDYVYD